MHRLIAEREPVFISGGAVAAPVGCDSLNPIPHSASLVQNQGVSFSTLPDRLVVIEWCVLQVWLNEWVMDKSVTSPCFKAQ